MEKILINDINSVLKYKRIDGNTVLCHCLNHREMLYCFCLIKAKYNFQIDFENQKTVSDIAKSIKEVH